MPRLIEELPDEVCYVLGDLHYNAPKVQQLCGDADRILVTPKKYGAYPHTDARVEVRRIFHKLRSQ